MSMSNKEYLKANGIVITFPELLNEFGKKKFQENLASLDYYISSLKILIAPLKVCKEQASATLPNTIFDDVIKDDIQKLLTSENEAEFFSNVCKLAALINQNMIAIKYP